MQSDVTFFYVDTLNQHGRLENRTGTVSTLEEAKQLSRGMKFYEIIKHVSHRYSFESGPGPIFDRYVVESTRTKPLARSVLPQETDQF